MIDKLTKEQELKIPEYVKKGLSYGYQTGPVNKEVAKEKVNALYAKLGLPSPIIHFTSNPKEANILVNKLLGQKKQELNTDYIPGNYYLSWLYFYTFIDKELGFNKCILWHYELQCLCESVGWFWPYEKAIIISDFPDTLHMINGRLHNTNGPAMVWGDDLKIYSLNGVNFSTALAEKFIIKSNVDIRPEDILGIKNVEQRAEVIKKYGINQLFHHLKPVLLDTQGTYELYSVPVYADAPRIYLKMNNPSIKEIHIEAVAPECRTVEQALNWRNFGIFDVSKGTFIAPMILT